MKIRKKTSFMLLAASTAAVVGVAAVSFAAWQGSGVDTLTASASTGDVTFFGFTEAHDPTVEVTTKLVPYNQPDGTYDDTCATVVSIAVPDYFVYEAYTVTVKATSEANLTLYAQLTSSQDAPAHSSLEGWKLISVANGEKLLDETTVTAGDVSGKYLHVILDSNDTQYNTQKKQSFSIEVTLKTNSAVNQGN